ncbi:hypothetical protein ACKWTF_013059 [Chironomus riparius]
MRLIILSSQLLAVLITIIQCDARSTRVTAQYTVADDTDNTQRTFRGKGIVEDASFDDGILTKYNSRPSRNPPSRGTKKKAHHPPSSDYEQISFHPDNVPEIFAVKGKVIDGDITVPTRSSYKSHPTQQRVKNVGKAKVQSVPLQQQFRFPSIKNEEIFETKLQEAPTTLHSKKFRPETAERPIYSYSTIKFNGDENREEEVFPKKLKGKLPKRSTATFNLEQNFGAQQTKFDTIIDHSNVQFDSSGFQPSTQFQFPTTTKTTTRKHKTHPPKQLFKSPEDEFKDSEFYDFSIRPRPGQQPTSGKYEKFSSDLGVKSLAIKPHKNKFDPPQVHNGGFKPSYKLKDITNLHSGDIGQGVASPGQIKTFYDAVDSERDERYALKLSSDPSPTSKAQLAQFLRAKEDERLEKLVEEQFKLHQQKQLQHEKEAELKHQQLLLQRQKEKIKHVEKNLNNKVNQRPKRRPNQQSNYSRRQQRNPSQVGFSVTGGGKAAVPMRTVKGKDGSYRVSFSI